MGYGADGICPYLAYEALFALQHDGKLPASMSHTDVVKGFIKGIGVGVLKVCVCVCVSLRVCVFLFVRVCVYFSLCVYVCVFARVVSEAHCAS